MSQRRTGGVPGGPRRPARRTSRPVRPRSSAVAAAAPTPPHSEPRRARPTGRALVLALMLAVLAVSYASSMKAYLQQRAHIAELKEEIAQRSASIDELEREKRRWDDDAYVRAQARERFGYLMPGETAYVVLDEHGDPIESRARLNDPDEVLQEPPTPWWEDAWASVELAGTPPREGGAPASDLGPPAR